MLGSRERENTSVASGSGRSTGHAGRDPADGSGSEPSVARPLNDQRAGPANGFLSMNTVTTAPEVVAESRKVAEASDVVGPECKGSRRGAVNSIGRG